jgi:hypothetical protein
MWCDFYGASLNKAFCYRTCFDFANMNRVSAQGIDLSFTSMYSAALAGADLRDAWMLGANIQHVIWIDDSHGPAMLPDGSLYEKDDDLLRFIDPDHPQFWVPDWFIRDLGLGGVEYQKDMARAALSKKVDKEVEVIWMPMWARIELEKEAAVSNTTAQHNT